MEAGSREKQWIAEYLLEEEKFLTALEFYQECQEEGHVIPLLQQFFTSPQHFSESGEFLGSKTKSKTFGGGERRHGEATQLSKILESDAIIKEKDRQINLLEYELRIAKEDIKELKKARPANREIIQDRRNSSDGVSQQQRMALDGPITDQEKLALAVLVNSFLMENDYKMSAVTFSDEAAEFNLDDFESAGFSSSSIRLHSMFRYYNRVDPRRHEAQLKDALESARIDKEESEKAIAGLKEEISFQQHSMTSLQSTMENLKKEKMNLEAKLERTVSSQPAAAKEADGNSLEKGRSNSGLRNLFRASPSKDNAGEPTITEDSGCADDIPQIVNSVAVQIFADHLPNIIPNVLINKREELLPVILVTIEQHPDASTRDSLTHHLFNLIKRPNDDQRHVIMDGCMSLARDIGPERTENELLPQCWEQINHKHPERRILVAESCGALASFVRPDLRHSLILSILQQMSDDPSPAVRVAVARNLGILVPSFETKDKVAQIDELMWKFLLDESDDVSLAAETFLMMVVYKWSFEVGTFWSSSMDRFVSVFKSPFEGDHPIEISATGVRHIRVWSKCLLALLPLFLRSLLGSLPKLEQEDFSNTTAEKNITVDNDNSDKVDRALFDSYLEAKGQSAIDSWEDLAWIGDNIISLLMRSVTKIDLKLGSNAQASKAVTEALKGVCDFFGAIFSTDIVKPLFSLELNGKNRHDDSVDNSITSEDRLDRLLPVFMQGVLPCLDDGEVKRFIQRLVVNTSLNQSGWTTAQIPVLVSSMGSLGRNIHFQRIILGVMWDMVVHKAGQVRATTVRFFEMMIGHLGEDDIRKRVLPALVTLTSDVDKFVRIESLRALCEVFLNVSDQTLLDQVAQQLDHVLEEGSHDMVLAIINSFHSIIPNVVISVRNEFVLPRLVRMSQSNNQNTDSARRSEIAKALFEAYRAYVGLMVDDAINESVHVGLMCLLEDSEFLDDSYQALIQQMIKDVIKATPTNRMEQTRRKMSSHIADMKSRFRRDKP